MGFWDVLGCLQLLVVAECQVPVMHGLKAVEAEELRVGHNARTHARPLDAISSPKPLTCGFTPVCAGVSAVDPELKRVRSSRAAFERTPESARLSRPALSSLALVDVAALFVWGMLRCLSSVYPACIPSVSRIRLSVCIPPLFLSGDTVTLLF